jgi:hypothetical protein
MALGARSLQTIPEVLCVDLGGARRSYGKPIFGFLGMDAIWTMIVRIDFDSGELSVLPSLPADIGEPLELFRDRGLPCASVRVAGRPPTRFTIDTGAGDTGSGDLESQLFSSLLEAGALSVVGDRLTATVARTTRARLGRVAELRIGTNRHSDLIFQESSRNAVSLDFLSRYVVVFDFPSKRMYLSPGKRFNDPDRHDLSGLHLSTVDDKRIVKSLDDHSAAQRAGLRVGDVLLNIDQTAVDSRSKRELRRMLGTPSTRWLTIRRGEATMQCTIELREEPAPSETTPRARTVRRNTFFQKLVPKAE